MSESKPTIDPYPLSTFTTLAGERNRDPILQVFKTFFPKAGDALELASGSGAHINYFAQHFPGITFQPSDCDVTVFEIIRANRARAGNTNVAEPLRIDLTEADTWPKGERLYDVIFAINVFHLAAVSAADGFAEAFDKSLREAGVAGWGLKDVRDIEKAANNRGIVPKQRLDLPANNFMLVFQKPKTAAELA